MFRKNVGREKIKGVGHTFDPFRSDSGQVVKLLKYFLYRGSKNKSFPRYDIYASS